MDDVRLGPRVVAGSSPPIPMAPGIVVPQSRGYRGPGATPITTTLNVCIGEVSPHLL
jgi:hypothetical protein